MEPYDPYQPFDLRIHFDVVLISGEVGVRKPDPAIYPLAAEQLGVPAHECVFVDDLAGNLPAEALGMTTVHHHDNPQTLRALQELFHQEEPEAGRPGMPGIPSPERPGGAMPERSVVLDQVRRFWEYPGADVDRAHELYHDDAVLEFPQSGERFEGVSNFTEWRRQYPAEVRYRVRRITAREDLAVVEVSASYNGGPWQYGVQLLEFRGDKVARERIYVMEGWEAPEWRAAWRSDTPADPPE